jgi:hypothetical protein
MAAQPGLGGGARPGRPRLAARGARAGVGWCGEGLACAGGHGQAVCPEEDGAAEVGLVVGRAGAAGAGALRAGGADGAAAGGGAVAAEGGGGGDGEGGAAAGENRAAVDGAVG